MKRYCAIARKTVLSEHDVEKSIKFANGALAAAGHKVKNEDSDRDLVSALRGEISFDEAVERAARRARR